LISGTHTYHLTYRMSSSAELGRHSLNLIGFDWSLPLSDITFSVTYPPSLNLTRLSLFTGPIGSLRNTAGCNFTVANSALTGHCHRLPAHNGVTVSLPISRLSFSPTPAQAALFLLALTILPAVFPRLRAFAGASGAAPDLHPAELSVLLEGEANPRSALVRLAARGSVILSGPADDPTVSDVRIPSDCAIDALLAKALRNAERGRLSGATLNRVLWAVRPGLSALAAESLAARGLVPRSPFLWRLCAFAPLSVGCVPLTFAARPAMSGLFPGCVILLLEALLVLVPAGQRIRLAPIAHTAGWTGIAAMTLAGAALWPLGRFASGWDAATSVVCAVAAACTCAFGVLAGRWTVAGTGAVRALVQGRNETQEGNDSGWGIWAAQGAYNPDGKSEGGGRDCAGAGCGAGGGGGGAW
jgi:hypothetical protein